MMDVINEEEISLEDGILHHQENVDLLPANIELSALEVTMGNVMSREMIMKEFQYTIKDACGIHARPAGLLVKTVKGFASTATLEKDGKSCDMRKLMALMGMGVKQGETVTIKVEGDDEEAAAEAIQKFLSENV